MKRHKLGSSGFLVENMELKIVDDKGKEIPPYEKGEILVKGDNVMLGYWQNEKATSETLKDGWLHTGDLGYLDNDGFLYVFGRFKSLLISNDGEKYSPEGIEEAMVDNSDYIEQAMLHNNQDPYTIMFLVPNMANVKAHLKSKKIENNSDDAVREVLDLFKMELEKFKPGGSHENLFPLRWMPAAIAFTSESFNEENKLMNSTMKVVRDKVLIHFYKEKEYMLSPAGKNLNNELNINTLKQLLK